jgi:hypothetical protein
MIKKVEMFTAICDICKTDICAGTEYSCWDSESLLNEMDEQNWYNESGKQYCPDCYSFDDGDLLSLNTHRLREDE